MFYHKLYSMLWKIQFLDQRYPNYTSSKVMRNLKQYYMKWWNLCILNMTLNNITHFLNINDVMLKIQDNILPKKETEIALIQKGQKFQ